ncbi:hypothetical protein LL251_07405 [Sphingobium naphthae]|nr:hypothetical protein [Sphingobium naphthae]
MVGLTYRDVEETLAAVHRIRPDKRIAFRARLKHLQREGWPEGANTGTGKRFNYQLSSLMQMALAIELLQAGLSPRRAVAILKAGWQETAISLMAVRVAHPILAQWGELGTQDLQEIFWCVHPEALQDLAKSSAGDEGADDIVMLRPGQLPPYFLSSLEVAGFGGQNRALVIGLRALTIEVDLKLFDVVPKLDSEEMPMLFCAELLGSDLTLERREIVRSFADFLKARRQ